MIDPSDYRVSRDLSSKIDQLLTDSGLLFRVFSRVKSSSSLESKINRDTGKYSESGRKIQDLFGFRVALYFPDDEEIVINILKDNFSYDAESSTIDQPTDDSFAAKRCNLIFQLPDELADGCHTLQTNKLIDSTFEVQIRTVLSEGWHEVEHDLRYKCKDDWAGHSDLERALNGIYASLETSEWSMVKLFDELAYRHYKSSEWQQMIRTKFRMRLTAPLSDKVATVLSTTEAGKNLYKLERTKLVKKIIELEPFPLTTDNLVFVCNGLSLNEEELTKLTPRPIVEILSQ